MFIGSRLPRNNIEFDPDWQAVPADSPHLLKWVNKSLELTAYCSVKDDLCRVIRNTPADPTLPDLTSYRYSLNNSHGYGTDITRYLSSIYLNPAYQDRRFLRRSYQADTSRQRYFKLF